MVLRPLDNSTAAGNEKAFRRGRVVPEDAVNLAYAEAPPLSPANNLVIVDTAQLTEDNFYDPRRRRKLYYANSLGILVDEDGQTVVADQYPVVTDVFNVDEDWSLKPGSEYKPNSMLPFVHVSRYFHVDHSGLTMGSEAMTYDSEAIKVVDEDGNDYVTKKGVKRYRIKIAAAHMPGAQGDSWAYRVRAYVDVEDNENLYLVYNKVEVASDATLKNTSIGYRELLNPQPVFEYVPEETDVIDPTNSRKKIYSTKPVTQKDQLLGKEVPDADGYQVYVPRKAFPDPRVFQTFRWRLGCEFVQEYDVDKSRSGAVHCGIIVTNKDLRLDRPTRAPYALLNLSRSKYNARNVTFKNPLKSSHAREAKEQASYWYVNIDDPNVDLTKYDLLLWAPNAVEYDFNPNGKYRAKIEDFLAKNGLLFVDTNNRTKPTGLGPSFTHPCNPVTKKSLLDGTVKNTVKLDTMDIYNVNATLIDGLATLGAWKIDNDGGNAEVKKMSFLQTRFDPAYSQYISAHGSRFSVLLRAKRTSDDAYQSVTVVREHEGGREVISTAGHLFTCSGLFANDGSLISRNLGPTLSDANGYYAAINSTTVEGAMKLLFNAAMLALRQRTPIKDPRNDETFATSWTYYSDWYPSWVIDGKVLTDQERKRFKFTPKPDGSGTYERKLWPGRAKSLIDRFIPNETARERHRLNGAVRRYFIEVTNDKVKTTTPINNNDFIYAWTRAKSPKFQVPVEIGPHVIKEEPRIGDYDKRYYTERDYPDLRYSCRVQAAYIATEEDSIRDVVNWTATGTALETVIISEAVPPSTETVTSDIVLSWADDGISGTRTSGNPESGLVKPDGIWTWQEQNYYTHNWGPGHKNWPYWRVKGRYALGSNGEHVMFIQDALNRFRNLGFFTPSTGKLRLDGYYGRDTAQAVLDFQTQLQARYKDGVVDAETWFLIGSQILRAGNNIGDLTDAPYRKLFTFPAKYMAWENLSNDDRSLVFAKHSWESDGPKIIWDLFKVTFAEVTKIHGLTVIPYVEGDYPRMMVRSLDVRTSPFSLRNYNSYTAKLIEMPFRAKDGEELYIPFGPYKGDTVILGVGQDNGAGKGWGTARMFGIRDILAHARKTTTKEIPGSKVVKQQKQINLSETGTLSISSFKEKTVRVHATSSGGTLSKIKWTNVSVDNPNVTAFITNDGEITFTHNTAVTKADSGFTKGVLLGYRSNATYYSMNEQGAVRASKSSPIPEEGRISKADGIKLLCTSDGKPFGFKKENGSSLLPTAVGPNESQTHYVRLSLASSGTASDVQVGFYDIKEHEFVTNARGEPEISYIEYIKRGPQNIYVGLISDYEATKTKLVPVGDDAPPIPFKWAMPVYGVYTRGHAQISLEALPESLGAQDMWPVAVKEGTFNRTVPVPRRSVSPVPEILWPYAGRNVRAFYSLPEARHAPYSTIYGRPNIDVKDEMPIVIDEFTIQVRQTPVLMVEQPTQFPGPADPVRPVFKVSTRTSTAGAWTELQWKDIQDYNVSTGIIHLKTAIRDANPNLVKVSYTTTRRSYPFKKYGNQHLNLNPYSGNGKDFKDTPIFIYLVPEYVVGNKGEVVAGSVNTTCLRYTIDPSIFDEFSERYNPLAVQLGMIYVSTALDSSTLTILDTRRRGGGLKDSVGEEIKRIIQQASSYWDVGYGAGIAYQKAGYIIIRLPSGLKNDFTEEEIRTVIERNITVGVGFKIEDLEGNDWS